MAEGLSYTIVEYFGGDDGYRCGYCKNEKGNFSHGMWSHTMTVQDYQDLIDRGWRRSGKYVYKPTMKKTCCPQYTIRCHALNFQPAKSHKKTLKKMSKFLSKGELPAGGPDEEPMDSLCEEAGLKRTAKACPTQVEVAAVPEPQPEGVVAASAPAAPEKSGQGGPPTVQDGPPTVQDAGLPSSTHKPGKGADPARPPCRKAKDLRKERRLQKEQIKRAVGGDSGASPATPTTPTPTEAPPGHAPQPKPLEAFIHESLPDTALHRLEVRLVRSSPPCPQFKASFDASYQVYKLYQMAIHKDPPEKPSESQFRRFLCDSPLEAESPPDGPEMGYGSFHQQYWLGDRMVAVGVVDILPTCVSSVYLYYHPEFASLSLGSYSALREIAFTRQLQKQSPKLAYYYLGFYIHSCPKMRYKGKYLPADLLCPETFFWVPIERCTARLENARYVRFNQDPDAVDARAFKDLSRVMVLYKRTVMPYAAYCRKRRGPSDQEQVEQYAALLGQTCAESILMYRDIRGP
ncbi:arginyl-tRNA--protein transferase 1 isoform X1 [Gadus morhua]|uniref:Arginyl-tRNA--protein transferase 1 n=1 Tax=Gadus morhua TaxID=8049 RepID=A0A8C4ZUS1_GADMO|nr:arginyl-tRNA--protein transferase 1 isoform X1 [Gadus morhua]